MKDFEDFNIFSATLLLSVSGKYF